MTDILPYAASLIEPVCENVELQFPEGQSSFPLVTLAEISSSCGAVLDGEERFSRIAVQIDVWDNGVTRQQCETLSQEICGRLTAAGFRRQSSLAIKEDGLHRRTMTFTVQIDERHKFIYD